MAFAKQVGIRVVRRHGDGVTVECPIREELMNGAGVVHGGVAATIADSAMGIALCNHFERKRRITTVEMKINYLRPIVDGKIVARAHIIRTGKSLCVGRVDLFDGDKNAVAVALLTYAILPGPAPKSSQKRSRPAASG